MTNPIRDPDDLSHEKDLPANNYHDEEPEIQNDEVPVHRPNQRAAPLPADAPSAAEEMVSRRLV